MSNRITHIRKPNVYSDVEHITDVKVFNQENGEFQLTVPKVIAYIKEGYKFFVRVGSDQIDVTFQTSASGREYIKTKPDRTLRDNLLSLPQF